MPLRFAYLSEKIEATPFDDRPFRHLYIEDFLSPDDFAEIVAAPEIAFAPLAGDEALIAELHCHSYKEIIFPGTVADFPTYLRWHAVPPAQRERPDDLCEGIGVVMRLQKTRDATILRRAETFFRSRQFWTPLARRFGIDLTDVTLEFGLQKYLDGYEISPHPDIRLKALTLMVNINPAPDSEQLDIHTRYLTLKPGHRHVFEHWKTNRDKDRCWIPWDWCTTEKVQAKNNSVVIFAPGDDTLHAVRARYDHLATQRTQLYANLWYKGEPMTRTNWKDLPSR